MWKSAKCGQCSWLLSRSRIFCWQTGNIIRMKTEAAVEEGLVWGQMRLEWLLEDVGVVEMRWWHHLWHTPLSCQWGSRSQAFGILSLDLSLVPHCLLFSIRLLCLLPQHTHQMRFSACSTWQHISLCPSILLYSGQMNQRRRHTFLVVHSYWPWAQYWLRDQMWGMEF